MAHSKKELSKKRVKIAISVAFHILASTMRLLGRVVGHPSRHRLVILYYHTVPPSYRASFARQLDMLAARTTVVPANFHGTATGGGHCVAITFDDAFTSVLSNALPELRARKMPATIFVPAGSLGQPPSWDIERENLYAGELIATAETLRSHISDLVELGAHSLTHPHLTSLSSETARHEIIGCNQTMSDLFGIDTNIFAFPYGDHDATIVELCRAAGYDRVFTIVPHVVDPVSNEFVRGRVAADPADGPLEFYLKMSGAYAWMAYASALKSWWQTRLHRS